MREEEKKRSSQDSRFKRFFKKRWVVPAIYIVSAAIILTAVLWYQNSNNASNKNNNEATDITGKTNKEPAVEVNRSVENIVMPVANPSNAVIEKEFYDMNASEKEQEAALVVYNNVYYPNTGLDIKMKDGSSFDVVAALSGTVTNVKEDSLLGNVIVIEHDKGIVTQYQSVTEMAVNIGEKVKQGQVLAKAGQSLLNEKAGTHVHFEIRKDNIPVNPSQFLNKPFSALQEATVTSKPAVDNSGATEENDGSTEKDNPSSDKESDSNKSGQSEDDSDEKEDEKDDVDNDQLQNNTKNNSSGT